MGKKVLVVANETIGGRKLLEAVKQRAEDGATFHLVVPQQRPKHGRVIYDETVRDIAQTRVDLARAYLSQAMHVEISAEIGDHDPCNATLDAVHTFQPDEILVSTHPVTASGWMRKDLVERIRGDVDVPVEHVVTDLAREGLPFTVTLVVANQTLGGAELHRRVKEKADESPHVFICVLPLENGDGRSVERARRRLAEVMEQARRNEVVAAGLIGDPDPYTAIQNCLASFRIGEVLISTLPGGTSGWQQADLVERVRRSTPVAVEHVESSLADDAVAAEHAAATS